MNAISISVINTWQTDEIGYNYWRVPLFQDLITHSVELCEDTGDLLKAHEFMLGLPQRKADASLIENISGYRGNLHKLGRLLRQVRYIQPHHVMIHRTKRVQCSQHIQTTVNMQNLRICNLGYVTTFSLR